MDAHKDFLTSYTMGGPKLNNKGTLDLNGGKSVSIEGGVYSKMKRKNMSFLVFVFIFIFLFHPPIAAKSSGLPSFSFGLRSGYYPNDSSGLKQFKAFACV